MQYGSFNTDNPCARIQFSSKFVADYVAAVADYLGELDNLYGYLEYIFDLWKMFPEGPGMFMHNSTSRDPANSSISKSYSHSRAR